MEKFCRGIIRFFGWVGLTIGVVNILLILASLVFPIPHPEKVPHLGLFLVALAGFGLYLRVRIGW